MMVFRVATPTTMASSEGFEPPTTGSEVRSSIQLGYEENFNL